MSSQQTVLAQSSLTKPATMESLLPPLPTEPVVERDTTGIQWDEEFVDLPSSIFMLEEDLGLQPGGCKGIARQIQQGGDAAKKAQAQSDQILEVYVEAMRRRLVKRPKTDRNGKPLYQDEKGAETTDRYRMDKWDRGVESNYAPIKEWRSRFGVGPLEARTQPPAPMIEPGHWMKYVRANWDDLLPKLKFKSKTLTIQPAYYRTPGEIERVKSAHADKVLNDESPERKELLAWLKPFLSNRMVSSWDGVQ